MRYLVRTSLLAVLAFGLAACSVAPPPSISAVESDTIVSSSTVTVPAAQASTLTIRGSDFGDPRGLNRLFYGGLEVSDAVIASWTDDAIELEFFDPAEIVGGDLLRLGAASNDLARTAKGGAYVAPDDQRFEVRTLSGASESEVVRLVSSRLDVGSASGAGATVSVGFRAWDLFGHPWPDLAVALQSNRGTLETTTLVTDGQGFATTTLTTVDALPHAVKALHDDRAIAQGAVSGLQYRASPNPHDVTPDAEASIELTVTDAATTPVADASLNWMLVSDLGPRHGLYDLGAHATGATGAVALTIPALPSGHRHDVLMIDGGYVVGSAAVRPTTAPTF